MKDWFRVLLTGGSGFIGSALVRRLVKQGIEVLNLDALTYAATPESLVDIEDAANYCFVHGDIRDPDTVGRVYRDFEPDAVVHLAAESHVDRSIDSAGVFIEANVLGTFRMLEGARAHRDTLKGDAKDHFRFVHISTDEVFGSLGDTGLFHEETAYDPSSPYSASKASSDHLVRAWGRTYGLNTCISNCSNNYGPRQFPEKLIPLVILKARAGERLPVYGDGGNVRDWLYVEDHASALHRVLEDGQPGRTYCIGGSAERTNLQVVHAICDILDTLEPGKTARRELIEFVTDRPGHDRRYAIDSTRIQKELGWKPSVGFEEGLKRTVRWYIDNERWWRPILDGRYQGERLGRGAA